MKRKPTPTVEPALSKEVIAQAKAVLDIEVVQRRAKCEVCGGEGAPNSQEGLCWVCRRLKISAWRDADQQMSAQE